MPIHMRQTHPHDRKDDVTQGLRPQRVIEKKISGRDAQGAWCQDKLIGDKPPVVK
jgi:hypothetical protein